MKVEFNESCAGVDFSFTKGRQYEIEGDLVVELLRSGLCKPVVSEPKIEKAERKPRTLKAVKGAE